MSGVMFRPLDPLELLRRRDKHRLAAGDGILFDPPQPQWLDRPGFWDGGRVFLHEMAPLFTVAFVEATGRERLLRCMHREWTPAELQAMFVGGGLEIEERRSVVAGGRFLSEWRVTNGMAEPVELSVVLWSVQEGARLRSRQGFAAGPEGIGFTRLCTEPVGDLELRCLLRFDQEVASGWAVYEAEAEPGRPLLPEWAATPFRDRWSGSALRGERRLPAEPAADAEHVVFMGLSRQLRLGAGETDSFTASMQLLPAAAADRPESAGSPPPPLGRGAALSRTSWQQYFAAAPSLSSSDPYLERYFPYRWYSLRLAALDPIERIPWPTVAAGTAGDHALSAAAAWSQVRELRWLADPARAQGTLRAFLEHLDSAGRMPRRFVAGLPHGVAPPDGDWGGALLALDEVHPDRRFLEACYAPLARYAAAVDADGDAEGLGLITRRGEGGATWKDVAATVCQYRLRRALAQVAAGLDRKADGVAHDAAADLIAEAVRGRMWDGGAGMFFDLDAVTLRPTAIKRAGCFAPYLSDLAGTEHLPGMARQLFDPAVFWTPFPVPSLAADQPEFQGDGFAGGVRRLEPTPGRVLPLLNCQIAEALGTAGLTLDPAWRLRAAEFLQRFLRMMCFEGDPARPNGFEHYSPDRGWPGRHRGLDDAPRGWINDLIIRYVVGVRPAGADLVVDPLPTGVERLRLERLPYRGRRIGVAIADGAVKVTVDGAVAAEGPVGAALTLTLPGSPARTPS